MSDLVSYRLEDGIATLTLDNGKVNAISHEVIAAFNRALDQAEQDRAVVIVTSARPGLFSGLIRSWESVLYKQARGR